MADTEIRVDGHAGRITLNRPQALNALNLGMVQAIDAALLAWAGDASVKLVVVDGAGGRALCAGGDIRMLYDAARTGDVATAAGFFAAEYAMNARIAHFPKPYVALMDGVVMGGGVGISAHGSVRVATERTVLAMPETGIGLFPDVGATWLLSRDLPRGLHLALTGARIGAGDAIAAGLADFFVPSAKLGDLSQALAGCADMEAVRACVGGYAETAPAAVVGGDWMAGCYGGTTMEAIVAALADSPHEAAQAAAREIAGKSPSSLKVTLRALREAASMPSLDAALAQELVIATGCMRSHDFVEGVRAVVVDKDRHPKWKPAELAAVSDAAVDAYFRKQAVLF
jgi:enoyl-CoA hydratase